MALHRLEDRGKMNKWAALKDMMGGADIIVEVVDARDIRGTRLPFAEMLAGSNRIFFIANKTDLLPAGTGRPPLPYSGMYVSTRDSGPKQRRAIIDAMLGRTKNRPARALLIGYPNVGKSTLINMLAKRKAAKVSAVAGTTKNIQWVKVTESLIVSDYRGIFPEKEAEDSLVRKGALNVQGDEIYHAHIFLKKVLGNQALRKWLGEKYDVDLSGAEETEEVLEKIARRRGWFVKGGEPNIQEAARSVVRIMIKAPEI